MWLQIRWQVAGGRWRALIALMVLAGCGFKPMYDTQNQETLHGAGIIIETPADQMGQQFKQNLEDKLNPTGMSEKPAYKLSVSLTYSPAAIGVSRDGTVSRYNVNLASNYVFSRLSDGKILKQDTIRHVGSYNNQANLYFSTTIAERDAISRGIVELSEIYRGRIGALLTHHEN